MKSSGKTGRISALQRLSEGNSSLDLRHRLSSSPVVKDARELLNKRSTPIVDARQLLNRSKIVEKEKEKETTPNPKIVISLVNDFYEEKSQRTNAKRKNLEDDERSTSILISNLKTSVTEEDVQDLFGQVGQIEEIQNLSPGCVQVTYRKDESAKKAISKYHNRLLDGQLMYVSLQSSKKIQLDPNLFREALFNSTASNSNSVRFQVKL